MSTPMTPVRLARSPVWAASLSMAILIGLFTLYVQTERQVDEAYERRQNAYRLAEALQQSSDDLTRMVRNYVVTRDIRYKAYFQTILDIRNGKIRQPEGYSDIYWDRVLAHKLPPPALIEPGTPLLDSMRQTEFSEQEMSKLAQVRKESDDLTALEFKAMQLMDTVGQAQAILLVHGENYNQAKARVMQPINEFFHLMDQRTLAAIHQAQHIANLCLLVLTLYAMATLLLLGWLYKSLRTSLGVHLSKILGYLQRLGQGNPSFSIPKAGDQPYSVTAGISELQDGLQATEMWRSQWETDARWYESIVRSSGEAIVSQTLEGIVTSWNASAERILGYTADNMIGQYISRILPTDSVDEHGIMGRIAKGETVHRHESIRRHQCGHPVSVSVTVSPIRDSDNRIIGASQIFAEISESIRAKLILEAALSSMNEAVSIVKSDGTFSMFNEAFVHFWRFNTPDECPKTLADSPRIIDVFRLNGEQVLPDQWTSIRGLQGETAAYEEYRLVRKDTGASWYGSFSFAPIRDQYGVIIGVVTASLDITNEYQLRQELKEQTERLIEAQRIAKIGNWEQNKDGRVVWSPETYQLMGTLQETTTPQAETIPSLIYPDDRVSAEAWLRDLNAGKRPPPLRLRRYLPDGTLRHLRLQGELQHNAHGRPMRMMGTVQDVTEIYQAEQGLLEAHDRHVFALEALNAGEWEWDLLSYHAIRNLRHDRIFGYDTLLAEWTYPLFLSHVLPEDREAVESAFQQALGSGTNLNFTCRIRRQDGDVRWIQAQGAHRINASGRTVLTGIVTDITERQTFLRNLADLNANLELKVEQRTIELQAANAAKSQFLANMSHEIRTPMNAVLGLAQLLEREVLTQDQRKMALTIVTAGRSLLSIINNILDFSKIEAGQLILENTAFKLDDLLAKAESLVGVNAHFKGLSLQIEQDSIPGLLVGDFVRVEQVLLNLGGNAVKFTQQGGITLRALHVEDHKARFRFEIQDTGIGMSPEDMDTLFAPFTQADGGITRRFGGTGLGLAICKRLVELMGGTLGVESRLQVGTTFWFELSFARQPEDANAQPLLPSIPTIPQPTGPRLTGLRVLVVDDSDINRDVVERTLKKEGALPTLAEDGQQAIQILKQQPEDFDSILLDIQMPVMDGLSAARFMRSELGLSQLPIIAFTAGVFSDEELACREAGFNDFLSKPVELEQLIATLLKWGPASAESHQFPESRAVPRTPPPPTDFEAFPSIPGLDTDRAAQILGNDRAFFLDLAGRFVAHFSDAAQGIRAALAKGDRMAAKASLHSLRGNAGNIGAMTLMASAQALEQAIADEDGVEALQSQIDALEDQLNALLTAIKPWLIESPPQPHAQTDANPPALDLEQIEALVEALSHSALTALDLFAKLRPGLATVSDSSTIDRMATEIKALRFQSALHLLNQVLGSHRPH